jgi:hypothetical protein
MVGAPVMERSGQTSPPSDCPVPASRIARLRQAASARWSAQSERRRRGLEGLAVVAALATWLVPIALQRLVDGDEGYLLMASRLVSEGLLPYRDFFLPQGPVLPAVFGACFRLFGRSWYGARVLAVLIAVATGALVYCETRAATRRWWAAGFATALYAASGATIGWLTIVKGYGLAAVWMMAALFLVGMAVRRGGDRGAAGLSMLAGAGALLGLAASTRLYTLAVAPALAMGLVARPRDRRLLARRLGAFALGCVVGLLPLLLGYAVAREAFVFDTIRFHAVREFGQDSLFGSPSAKLPIVLKALGFHGEASYGDRQLMGLVLVAVFAFLARLGLGKLGASSRSKTGRTSGTSTAGWAWLALLAASVLPNPFQPQYFCLLVPFLAVEGGLLLVALLRARPPRLEGWWPRLVVAGACLYLTYHAAVGWHERDRFLHTGEGVPGVESSERAVRWRLATIAAVARAIDAQRISPAGSWWPGYLVSTRASLPVTLANDFGLRAAETLPLDTRRKLHLVTSEEIGDMVRQRTPRLFVAGNWAAHPYAAWLPAYGYRLRQTIENVRLWVAE